MTTALILLGDRSLSTVFFIAFGFFHDSAALRVIEYFPHQLVL